jgi:hypothetical protein
MIVFCDVTQYSLVEVLQRFKGIYCLRDYGSKHLRNVGKLLPV